MAPLMVHLICKSSNLTRKRWARELEAKLVWSRPQGARIGELDRGQATMSKDGEGNLQSAKTFVFEPFEATFYCIRRKVLMEFNI
jgi:hypothetical protein